MNVPAVFPHYPGAKISGPSVAATKFDYGAVHPALVENLRRQTDRILARMRKHVSDIIEMGRDLLAVKNNLDRGLFTEWVAIELKMEMRTAQRFMAAARLADEVKSDTVSLLPPATVYRLAAKSTPPEIRDGVLRRAASGDVPSDKEVADILATAASERKEDERRKAREEARRKETPKQRRTREQREKANREWRETQLADQVRIKRLIEKLIEEINPGLVAEVHAGLEQCCEAQCGNFDIGAALFEVLSERAQRNTDDGLDIPPELRRAPA